MTDINQRIQTALLRRAVQRTRYENAVIQDAQRRFRAALEQTVQALRHAGTFDGRHRASMADPDTVLRMLGQRPALAALMQTVSAFWRAATSDVGRTLNRSLRQYVDLDLLEVPRLLSRLLTQAAQPLREAVEDRPGGGLGISFTSLPSGQISQLVTTPLGSPQSTFEQALEDLSARLLSRVRGTLTTGLARGQSVPQVARALQSTMRNTRWEAERIVRSEFTRVAAQSSLLQYQQNRDLLAGVQWVSTLDARTCLQCGVLDGQTWETAAAASVPVVDTHPNCRCIVVPIVASAARLGLPDSTRASFSGQVPATTKYPTWFRQQDAAFQRAVLGPTRYRLFRQGRLTIRDFATASGVRSVAQALQLARSA